MKTLLIVFSILATGSAYAGGFEFKKIATTRFGDPKNTQGFTNLMGMPSINLNGDVAYWGNTSSGEKLFVSRFNIETNDYDPAQVVAAESGMGVNGPLGGMSAPVINNSRDVAYWAGSTGSVDIPLVGCSLPDSRAFKPKSLLKGSLPFRATVPSVNNIKAKLVTAAGQNFTIAEPGSVLCFPSKQKDGLTYKMRATVLGINPTISINSAGSLAFSAKIIREIFVFDGANQVNYGAQDTTGVLRNSTVGGLTVNQLIFSAAGFVTEVDVFEDIHGNYIVQSNGTPFINDNGDVAVYGRSVSQLGNPLTEARAIHVIQGSDNKIVPVVYENENRPTPIFDFFAPDVSFNSQGVLAYLGFKVNGVSGFFKSAFNGLGTIPDNFAPIAVSAPEGPFEGFGTGPSIAPLSMAANDAGNVAFIAAAPGTGFALFASGDPEDGLVIKGQTTIDGSTASGVLNFGKWGLNQEGKVAFVAGLNDGSVGVFVGEKIYNISTDFFQVIKNPNLNSVSEPEIDLVSGKNLDVEVKVKLGAEALVNFDVSKLTLKLANVELLRKSDQTNENGIVTFEMNPIPSHLFSEQEVVAVLKDDNGTILAERQVSVNVRSVLPIKLGFVAIKSSKNTEGEDRYELPDPELFEDTVFRGGALASVVLPVANAHFGSLFSSLPITGLDIQGVMVGDRNHLDKLILDDGEGKEDARRFRREGVTHVVGVGSNGYFSYHETPQTGPINGQSSPLSTSLQVRAGRMSTVAHELGHIFCIRYDNLNDCSGVPKQVGHPAGGEEISGYSNADFSSLLGLSRGLHEGWGSIMEASRISDPLGYWFTPKEFETIFKNNLTLPQPPGQKSDQLKIVIAGHLDGQGVFVRDNSYLSSANVIVPANSVGAYLVEGKDIDRNVIFSMRFDATVEAHSSTVGIKVAVPLSSNLAFVDIYRDGRMRQGIDSVVVPIDPLIEGLRFTPDRAFKGDAILARQVIDQEMASIRQLALDKNLPEAIRRMSSNLLPIIKASLKDEFVQESLLDVGLREVSFLAVGSLVRMASLDTPESTPFNPFVRASQNGQPQIGERVQLRLEPLREASDPEMMVVHTVFFDGQAVPTTQSGNYLVAESFRLNAGSHSWQVRSNIVPRRTYKSMNESAKTWRLRRSAAEYELEAENDPEKRVRLEQEIVSLNRKIMASKSLIDSESVTVGQMISIPFIVQ